VTFTVDAYPERNFTGTVEQVRNSPIVTQNVVTYDVVVRVDNKDLMLKPGMTANVTIQVKKHENALKIPNAALRYRPADLKKESTAKKDKMKEPSGQRVYVPGKDGTPVPVLVRAGISDGTFTLLVEGSLKEGDILITGDAPQKKNSASGSPPGMGMGGFR